MATFPIRTFGDPVLKQRCSQITEIDGSLARLADDMIETMYAAPGVGLAANQVGIQRRIFVYDAGDGPHVVINPTILEVSEEWHYEEGCLSVPGLYFPIVRPRKVTLTGLDLNGREFTQEAEDLLGRIFLHETDHLDGYLLLDRLDPETRKKAMQWIRREEARGGPGRPAVDAPRVLISPDAPRSGIAGDAPHAGISGDTPYPGISGDTPYPGISGDTPHPGEARDTGRPGRSTG